MSQKPRQKISLDFRSQKWKGYHGKNTDGYNTDSGNLAFGTFEDWARSKTRQRMGKENKPLF